MRATKLRTLSRIVVAMLAVAAIGCGSGGNTEHASTHEHSSAEARAYAIDHIQTRLDSFARTAPLYTSASDLLGNVRFAEGNRQAQAFTDAVVVGTVSDVVPGYGFAVPSSGAEGKLIGDGIQVPFDSPDALWRTVHITVDVEDVLSGDIANSTKQITVGLAIGNVNAEDDLIRDGLKTIGRSVWFLWRDSPVFAYDNSLYADLEDGRLIAQVTPDGSLSFPLLAKTESSADILGRPTLAQLREAAKLPPRVVQLHRDENNILTR